MAFEDEHTEGPADGIESKVRSQRSFDLVDAQAINFHIDVLGGDLQQAIPDAATDE
jgi:hypothetical protein